MCDKLCSTKLIFIKHSCTETTNILRDVFICALEQITHLDLKFGKKEKEKKGTAIITKFGSYCNGYHYYYARHKYLEIQDILYNHVLSRLTEEECLFHSLCACSHTAV